MKIALLTDGIWPFVIGGMQKHSYLLCKYLTARSVIVIVFHPKLEENVTQKLSEIFTPEELACIEWIEVPKPKHYRFPGHYLYESYLFSKNIFSALRYKVKDIDFIYSKGLTSWYLLKKRKTISQPLGINIHGYEFLQRHADFRERLNAALLFLPFKFINKKADYVFSYGGKVSHYIKHLGVADNKIIEISGAVENGWLVNERVVKKSRPRRFIYVGRYERRKGIQELNNVLKYFLAEFKFEFHFVGPIPESLKLNHQKIIYHGQVSSKDQLTGLLDDADILICASYSEGMPNVILEAMARGCAIIGTDVGAVSLMVNEHTGWLIQPASYVSLKEAMKSALTLDEDELINKSRAALKLIGEKYTWDRVGERTLAILEKLVPKQLH